MGSGANEKTYVLCGFGLKINPNPVPDLHNLIRSLESGSGSGSSLKVGS